MEIEPMFLVLIPVVLGVVQAIKKLGMSSRFAPVLSIVLGIVGVWLSSDFVLTGATALQGVIAGLSAAGLWSGVKRTVDAK